MIVRLPLGRLNNHMCDRLLLIMIVALHTVNLLGRDAEDGPAIDTFHA